MTHLRQAGCWVDLVPGGEALKNHPQQTHPSTPTDRPTKPIIHMYVQMYTKPWSKGIHFDSD